MPNDVDCGFNGRYSYVWCAWDCDYRECGSGKKKLLFMSEVEAGDGAGMANWERKEYVDF